MADTVWDYRNTASQTEDALVLELQETEREKVEWEKAHLRCQRSHFPLCCLALSSLRLSLAMVLFFFVSLCLCSYACPVLFEPLKWLVKGLPASLVSSRSPFLFPLLG